MQRQECQTQPDKEAGKLNHAGRFSAALDSRNRKIPHLLTRNGRFYAQLWADKGDGTKTARKFPLKRPDGLPAANLSEARVALDLLRNDSRQEKLPTAGRKPGFSDFAAEYLTRSSTLQKKPGTRQNEKECLSRWKSHLGNTPVDKITTAMISAFQEKRFKGGRLGTKELNPAAPRTVRLDCIMLRNVLRAAVDSGHIRDLESLPRFPVIKTPPPPRRNLLTHPELASLLEACTAKKKDGEAVTKNGELLRDYLRFLAFTGCREQEALAIRWAHVDFEGERLYVGASEDFEAARLSVGEGGSTKNRGSRMVDFNPQLSSLLKEIHARRDPSSSWIFPSPQRGERDIPARSLRESLLRVRSHAKLPEVAFHHLRDVFCSECVMAGIDYMTIAAWVGHKDGGILIGKVYGHLREEHRKKAAAKLSIGSL